MSPGWTIPILLQSGLSRLEMLNAMRQGLGKEDSRPELYSVALGLTVVVGLLLLVPYMLQRRQRRSHDDYLAGAARRLGLARGELRSLRRIARRARLAHPLAMLLSPGNLAFALRTAVGEGEGGRLRRRVEAVSRRVFVVGLPAATAKAPSSDNPVKAVESPPSPAPPRLPATFRSRRGMI